MTNKNKYIQPTKNHRYKIIKILNGKSKYFGTYDTITEARRNRDYLVDHNWQLPDKIQKEKKIKEYYKNIKLTKTGYKYNIEYKHKHYLSVDTIEEALYARDQILNGVTDVKNIDLKKDNHYLTDGLKYPLPDRLKLKERKRQRGNGIIFKNSKSSYQVFYSHNYLCSCRTYEQAYYVKQELKKQDWDTNKLPEILKNYPEWYTWLMYFYQYITFKDGYWVINVPTEFLPEDKQIVHIEGYRNIEDALYERDFLMENGWDYDYLVECIDDSLNPYYDMELPPYPERKIRKIIKRDYHEKEIQLMADIIMEDDKITRDEVASILGVGPVTILNWLKLWNTTFREFKQIVLAGENPLELLEKKELIYTPDLSKSKHSNFKGYIHKSGSEKNRRKPYIVYRNRIYYGAYASYKQAVKVRDELVKCGWDKTRLNMIKEKVGVK